MFFSKNKKTNSKIRFQQSGFRQRLQNARDYKRQPAKHPALEHMWTKMGAGVIIIGVFYLIYAPNFLFIKTIKVNGVSGQSQNQIISLTEEYLRTKPLTAQSNWLFLSKNKLANYISQRDQDIVSVDSVKKSFPQTVSINVTARITTFSVTTPLQQLLVSNDGQVRQDITGSGTSTAALAAGLVPVTIDNASSAPFGANFFSQTTAQALNLLNNLTVKTLNLGLDHFEISNLQSQDITEYTSAGFKLMFNTTLNLTQNINQAQLLIANLADNQKKTLYYIDMRFDGKAFACYKNTACVQTPVIQDSSPAASSTLP